MFRLLSLFKCFVDDWLHSYVPLVHPLCVCLWEQMYVLVQAVFEKRLKDAAVAVPLLCCAADMVSVAPGYRGVVVAKKPYGECDRLLPDVHAS